MSMNDLTKELTSLLNEEEEKQETKVYASKDNKTVVNYMKKKGLAPGDLKVLLMLYIIPMLYGVEKIGLKQQVKKNFLEHLKGTLNKKGQDIKGTI